jgi:hypothetical protein
MRHNRTEPLALTCLGLLLCLAPATLAAQDEMRRPTVTVVSFEGPGSLERLDAMADELAMRLVETGRFRVLEREWLAVPAGPARPSVAVLRDVAAGAGVEYLVLGSVRPLLGGPISGPVTIGGPLLGAARLRSRMLIRPARTSRPPSVSVNVRVVDVSSGDVVRTSVAGGEASASTLRPALLVAGSLFRGPLGAITAVRELHPRASRLDGATQHALADIAHTLNVPVPPVR